MQFNSFAFLIFFLIVFPLYCAFNQRWQNRLLLVASYVFYGWVEPRFVCLMAFTTLMDYFIGLKMGEAPHSAMHHHHEQLSPEDAAHNVVRKRWLTLSIIMNLTLLGFFKYYNFFITSAAAALQAFGLHTDPWTLNIWLPVGISFYTFHEISYTVDVYRGHVKPARSLTDFACFISFFPQLVAGPIGRATWQLPQFQRPRRMTWERWCEGATLFLIGLFKKIAVADVLALAAQQTFAHPERCSRGTLLFGLYCFSFQIYADFSGYSDMARGLARAMGFDLIENFNHPYFSASITEFWRRWHISLSTWLRDYLYIPLGGNRFGTFNTYRNLFLTMFLGGLWHGAAWNFAIWGSMHGAYLAVHKLILGERKPVEVPPKDTVKDFIKHLLKMLATFHLVALTWIFFRAGSFTNAWTYLIGLVGAHRKLGKEAINFDGNAITEAACAVAALILFIDIPQYMRRNHTVLLSWPIRRRVAVFAGLTLWLLLMRGVENVPFIYFQF